MTLEFVVIDDGKEVDWIDPVISYDDCGDHWKVDNGYGIYRVDHQPNRETVVRKRIEYL